MKHKGGTFSQKSLDTPLFIVAAEDPKPAQHSIDSVCAKKYSSVDRNKEQKKKRSTSGEQP